MASRSWWVAIGVVAASGAAAMSRPSASATMRAARALRNIGRAVGIGQDHALVQPVQHRRKGCVAPLGELAAGGEVAGRSRAPAEAPAGPHGIIRGEIAFALAGGRRPRIADVARQVVPHSHGVEAVAPAGAPRCKARSARNPASGMKCGDVTADSARHRRRQTEPSNGQPRAVGSARNPLGPCRRSWR